jgi:hypothetical protein
VLGDRAVEAEQRADQMYVRLDRLEHLGFEQKLLQAQPVHGVALHDLDDRGGEVPTDVAQPAGDAR